MTEGHGQSAVDRRIMSSISETARRMWDVPAIPPVPAGTPRCLWSVMIPTFNTPATFLREALESVLQQDPGPDVMQIKVVDDASIDGNSQAVVAAVGRGRIEFERNPRNLGQARNLNRCISRARGHLVHLLHADDFVSPVFYAVQAAAAARHREIGVFASQSRYIEASVWTGGSSPLIRQWVKNGRDVSMFFYETPIQTPGVVVRRESYERVGGFSPSLAFLVDLEAWVRLISTTSAFMIPTPLASYRMHSASVTRRSERNGAAVLEAIQMNRLFTETDDGFSVTRGRQRVAKLAWRYFLRFLAEGDEEAARVNHRLWTELAPPLLRFRYAIKFWVMIRWKLASRTHSLHSPAQQPAGVTPSRA